MGTRELPPPLSEETPRHGDDDEFLEGLRDEQRSEHYSPRPDDWRQRRLPTGDPVPEARERERR